MSGVIHFITYAASAISSFFHSLIEFIKLLAHVLTTLPTYTVIFGGAMGVWLLAFISVAVVLRVLGRE